jgi:hypothetical protein
VEASVLLCDFAEDLNGKLYVMGGGWNRLVADTPTQIAIAVLLEIPWDQANRPHGIKIELLDEDGHAVTPPGAEAPILIEGKLEVGRPPGSKPGSALNAPLAIKIPVFVLPTGGYRFEFSVDGTVLSRKSFDVVSQEG